jgi:hypothetical protein
MAVWLASWEYLGSTFSLVRASFDWCSCNFSDEMSAIKPILTEGLTLPRLGLNRLLRSQTNASPSPAWTCLPIEHLEAAPLG